MLQLLVATFQLTRSRGAWPQTLKADHALMDNFNSHAHVERDGLTTPERDLLNFYHLLCVIFQLTRSRGAWLNQNFMTVRWHMISTHTLTWSVTLTEYRVQQLEKHFNSHAHVERDFTSSFGILVSLISTHTLTWSVTIWVRSWRCDSTFQLTRSRGAWPGLL